MSRLTRAMLKYERVPDSGLESGTASPGLRSSVVITLLNMACFPGQADSCRGSPMCAEEQVQRRAEVVFVLEKERALFRKYTAKRCSR